MNIKRMKAVVTMLYLRNTSYFVEVTCTSDASKKQTTVLIPLIVAIRLSNVEIYGRRCFTYHAESINDISDISAFVSLFGEVLKAV